MSILITGANGFLGSALTRRLLSDKYSVRLAVRRAPQNYSKVAKIVLIPGLAPETDWAHAVHSIKTIVRCAGRVHITKETAKNPLEAFRYVNVQGTLKLARQAAEAGVQRFILISSIGVNGAETFDQPFKADDIVAPHSPYAHSKWEIEQALLALGIETGMEIVVIRAPMIYGRNAPGNFIYLWRAVRYQDPAAF